MNRYLDAQKIAATARKLHQRIRERFPGSGLKQVAKDLVQAAENSIDGADALRRPYFFLRFVLFLVVVLLIGSIFGAIWKLELRFSIDSLAEFIQVLEAGVNDVVFLAVGLFFLLTYESRLKRDRALKVIYELRTLAHIVDMHQLTKDPERLLIVGPDTASSPMRSLDLFQLSRYLDYCTEMLAIISKIAALYGENLRDPVVLDAVDGVENLSAGLSRKIFQKLSIINSIHLGRPSAGLQSSQHRGVTLS